MAVSGGEPPAVDVTAHPGRAFRPVLCWPG